MSSTGVALLSLSVAWLISAGVLLYIYYKICQAADREYFRRD